MYQEDKFRENKLSSHLDFADIEVSHPIRFLKLIDLDNQIIKVPYLSKTQTLKQLKQYYLSSTTYQYAIENPHLIGFRSLQNSYIEYKAYHRTQIKAILDECNQQLISVFLLKESQLDASQEMLEIKQQLESKKMDKQYKNLANEQNAQENIYQDQYNTNALLAKSINSIISIQGLVTKLQVKTMSGKSYILSVVNSDIDIIHQQISIKHKLQPEKFKLIHAGKVLDSSKSLIDYHIQDGDVLQIIQDSPDKAFSQKSAFKFVLITFYFQRKKVELTYSQVKKLTVRQIVSNQMGCQKNYYLMYEAAILTEKTILQQIENYIDISKSSRNEYLNLKAVCCQKLVYIELIQKARFLSGLSSFSYLNSNCLELIQPLFEKKRDQIAEKLVANIKQQWRKQIYRKQYRQASFQFPILAYCCKEVSPVMTKYLQNIITSQSNNSCQFSFTTDLARSLKKLPNFIIDDVKEGTVFRGIEKFRLANFYREDQIFCTKNFLSTTNKKQDLNFLKNKKNYTILNIRSLTGKHIQDFCSQKDKWSEVVFLPYTYFYIEKITRNQHFDEIFVVQMPSSNYFSKESIVWADDNPINNKEQIEKLENKGKQIITLTSTRIAQLWMNQFNWLYSWREIKFKLITDMVKNEKFFDKKDCLNLFAGANLIQMIYKSYGYSTNVLIYCLDENKANQNIKQIGISNSRLKHLEVTASKNRLYIFAGIEANQKV